MIRVLIVDDDLRVRAALRAFLGAHPGVEVIGEADSSATALAIARAEKPSVAIVDVRLPDMRDGLELLRGLAGELKIPVIAISLDASIRRSALDAGAFRFLEKASPPEFLLEALRQSVGQMT